MFQQCDDYYDNQFFLFLLLYLLFLILRNFI